jgi:hypothetical protein
MKSGSLKLLEPSRPVQASTGIALPFSFYPVSGPYRKYRQEHSTLMTPAVCCMVWFTKILGKFFILQKITSVSTLATGTDIFKLL